MDDISTSRKYGFLYGGFAKNRIWWEAVIMTRKVMFLVCACFMYKQEVSLKAGTAMVILVIFMNLHIAMKPYAAEFAVVGLMEGLGMMVNFFTYASVLLLGPEKLLGDAEEGQKVEGASIQKLAIFWFCLFSNLVFILLLVGMVIADVLRNQGRMVYRLLNDQGCTGCWKVLANEQIDKYRAKVFKAPCCKKCRERHEDEQEHKKKKKTSQRLHKLKSVTSLISLGAVMKSNKHKTIKRSWLAGLAGADITLPEKKDTNDLAHMVEAGGLSPRRGGGIDKKAAKEMDALKTENAELKAKLSANRKLNVANRLRLGLREQKIIDLRMGGVCTLHHHRHAPCTATIRACVSHLTDCRSAKPFWGDPFLGRIIRLARRCEHFQLRGTLAAL